MPHQLADIAVLKEAQTRLSPTDLLPSWMPLEFSRLNVLRAQSGTACVCAVQVACVS
jgi:hypothetical protein